MDIDPSEDEWPSHDRSGNPDPHCLQCGQVDRIWMAHNTLWRRHGNGRGRLCIPCFEKRLGRRMRHSDLMPSCPPCNLDLMCLPRHRWNVRKFEFEIKF